MSGVELATAYVNLAYQDSITTGARRELAQVERDSVASGKKVGSNLSSGVSGALKAAGGLLAAAGVGGFLRDSIAGARESNKVAAVTANAIKVTGGAAKVTARQVGDLAAAISAKTGVDDEAIQSGANLLLTFKNVRNEVGAGNDIFSQATASAQDLAAAGFGSADSAAKMLGKALNDPIKGMSALGRAGVTFTAAQKEQIAALVETGDVLGAQKIIMAEVQSQVGGAAEATATAGDKAAVAFGNLQEVVGAKLLPIIDKGATKLTAFVTGMQDGTGAGGKFAGVLGTVWSVGGRVVSFVDRYQDIIIPLAAGIGAIVVAQKAWTIATGIATAAQALFNAALAANPIGLVILAIVGLGTALVVAYKKSETFRDIVNGAWTAVSSGAKYMWNDVLRPTLRALLDGFLGVAGGILKGAEKAFGWVPGIGDKLKSASSKFEAFRGDVNRALGGIDDRQVSVGIQFRAGSKLYYAARHIGKADGGFLPMRFADGGVMPGYTPGRDVHTFVSPTGGVLELSGGEPVLRPEAGRVLGRGWVDGINAAARSGGTGGVSRFLGRFAGGGVIPRALVPSYGLVAGASDEQSLQAIARVAEGLTRFGAGGIGGKTAGLIPEFLARLGMWNQALGGIYSVFSGFRSIAEQTILWNRSDKSGRMVARPGSSRHNFGTAADLAPGTTAAHRALAPAFGMSFPMSYEPWHIQMLRSGGHVRPFVADSGVTLAPGINVVHNKLGKPEPLGRLDKALELGPQTLAALDRMMTARMRVELDGLLLSRTMAGYEAGRVGF